MIHADPQPVQVTLQNEDLLNADSTLDFSFTSIKMQTTVEGGEKAAMNFNISVGEEFSILFNEDKPLSITWEDGDTIQKNDSSSDWNGGLVEGSNNVYAYVYGNKDTITITIDSQDAIGILIVGTTDAP